MLFCCFFILLKTSVVNNLALPVVPRIAISVSVMTISGKAKKMAASRCGDERLKGTGPNLKCWQTLEMAPIVAAGPDGDHLLPSLVPDDAEDRINEIFQVSLNFLFATQDYGSAELWLVCLVKWHKPHCKKYVHIIVLLIHCVPFLLSDAPVRTVEWDSMECEQNGKFQNVTLVHVPVV